SGAGYPQGEQFALVDGRLELPGVPAGHYTVSGSLLPGWGWTGLLTGEGGPPAPVTPIAGTVTVEVFDNRLDEDAATTVQFLAHEPGTVVVTKSVVDNAGGPMPGVWAFRLTGCGESHSREVPSGGGTATFAGLDVGCPYSIVEVQA